MRKAGLVVGDGGFDLFLAGEAGFGGGVELGHEVEFAALEIGAGLGWGDVGDGGVSGVEDGALVGGGEEAGVEVIESAGWDEATVEDDEAGEVPVF